MAKCRSEHPPFMRPFPLLILLGLAAFGPGCTAIKASYHLVDAEIVVKKAEAYGANVHAIYEYTMALRYLDKAREENGYSEYRLASELAQTSAEWADQAVISMDTRGLKLSDPPQLLPGQTAPQKAAPSVDDKSPSTPTDPGYQVPAPGEE